jgi:iron complex outermembrane recepter protein
MRTMLLAATALTASIASPTLAQTTAPAGQAEDQTEPAQQSGVQDIVVTAQRRGESIQDVPIAISAFSGEQLVQQGVSNTLELGQFVPNLVAQNNTGLGSANAFYLRGLGNTETIPTFDPPVGTYVDDIYLSRQNANNLSLFDVERVEVLRGPQGTLFGRNTTGGAINVILRQPNFDRISGYAEIGYGAYNKRLARASVDIPLAPTFAAKISGYYQDDDGYAKNTTTGERVNDDDGWGVRLGLRGELSPSARWSGSYAYIEANGENLLNFDCDPRNSANCDGRFVTTGLRQGRRFSTSPYAPLVIAGRKQFYGLGNYTQTHLVTSDLQFDIAKDTTLTFITGYVSQAQQYSLDFSDGRALPNLAAPIPPVRGDVRGGFDILNDSISNQFSQEIKLNGTLGDGLITYVGGFFYIKEDNRTDFADLFTLSPTLTLVLADRILRNSTEAYAGYFQGDVNLGQFTLTAGIRYTDETKTISLRDNRPQCQPGAAQPATCLSDPNLVAGNGVRIPLRQEAKIWTPRFAINWEPTDDLLLFVSATKGFKSGGWNARGTTPGTFLPFGPEQVWSYEAGLKSEFFDNRVRANLTLYRADVEDLQTPSALVGPTGAITFLTRNFADYRNQGAEFELTIVPVEGLNLYANVGYQDDKYILRDGPGTDLFGIQSVAGQIQSCRAQLAAGQVPAGTNTTPAGTPPNNAPACAAGIVTAQGTLATPVRTPDFTGAAGISYRARFGGGWSLLPSINASYRGDQEVQTSNLTFYGSPTTGVNGTFPANVNGVGPVLQGSRSEAAWLVNASITLFGRDDAWSIAAACTNCFDEIFVQSSLANTTYINQPRMWTVRARYNF